MMKLLLMIIILPLITSCTALMLNYTGTDYSLLVTKNTSQKQIQKILGKPISSQAYNTAYDFSEEPELKNILNPHNKRIVASETYKISGTVRLGEENIGGSYVLLFDVCTLGLFEVIAFPIASCIYVKDKFTEKRLTIWYGENYEFAVGEITEWKTHNRVVIVKTLDSEQTNTFRQKVSSFSFHQAKLQLFFSRCSAGHMGTSEQYLGNISIGNSFKSGTSVLDWQSYQVSVLAQ